MTATDIKFRAIVEKSAGQLVLVLKIGTVKLPDFALQSRRAPIRGAPTTNSVSSVGVPFVGALLIRNRMRITLTGLPKNNVRTRTSTFSGLNPAFGEETVCYATRLTRAGRYHYH